MTKTKNWVELAKSGGACGILLIIRPLINLLFSRQRDLNAYSIIDSSAIIFIIYSFVCFFTAWYSLSTSKTGFVKQLLTRTPIIWFMIFTIYGGISMIWSVNYPLSGYRAFECMAMILLIVAIMQKLFSTCDTEKIIKWTILYVIIDIAFSIISTLKWTTAIPSLLSCSQMMSTTFFFMALYYPNKKWYHYLIIIMAIFSGSTVAYIGMAAGMISVLWRKTKYKAAVLFGIIFLSFAVAVIGPQKVLKNTIFHDKESISLEETSGRDIMMEASIETIKENPMGLGFFAGEPYMFYSRGLHCINAHNSLFSAGIGMGYIGVILMAIFLYKMFFTTFSKKIPLRYRATFIGCFFVAFLHCMGNPALGSRVYGAWLPVTFLFILICSFYVYGKYHNKQ